jgi:hypothetical protein
VTSALVDLADRWRRARRAALFAVVPEADRGELDEPLLARALARDAASVSRRVFDNSLRLGTGFARHFGEPDLNELPHVLGTLGVPCLHGDYAPARGERALELTREGCDAAPSAGRCDFWREAVDGLVLGMTGGIRHARHESRGHGSGRCRDVFFVDPESALRFGPIPEAMASALERVRGLVRAFQSSIDVEFLGLSEGTLYYQERRGGGCQGGEGGDVSVASLVQRSIRRRFPEVSVREISPRPVLAGDGG